MALTVAVAMDVDVGVVGEGVVVGVVMGVVVGVVVGVVGMGMWGKENGGKEEGFKHSS